MNLPNYFLADLPVEAILRPEMIREACLTLTRNRARYLANLSTDRLIDILSRLGEQWQRPEDPFRKLALEIGPASTGFPRPTLAAGLDAFFRQLTAKNLHALVLQDLGHERRLDEFAATDLEHAARRPALATGPELLVHIAAGNLPIPTLTSMVLGLLVRSAQFVKCATGASLVPRLFAHSLYEAEPKLGACLEIAEWKGGQLELEAALFEHANLVTATGGDEALAGISRRLPPSVRFVPYGHRVSFGYVARDALTTLNAKAAAGRAAADVAAWNQLGCLSPHVIYAEHGGRVSPDQFAAMLADELAGREKAEPRGELAVETAAAIAARRSAYEIRAAVLMETRQWHSEGSTAWTVVYEVDPRFQLSCLHRFVYVKGVAGLDEALQAADAVREKVSTVGLEATGETSRQLATRLARWGVTRVCPLGQMQSPPLAWRHDGRPGLGDLVQWTDWEQ